MSDKLSRLYAAKAAASAADEMRESYAEVEARGLARRGERRFFSAALRRHAQVGLIAEMKHASPSAGVILEDFDPAAIAAEYEACRVDAISVLTEESGFLGKLAYLDVVRSRTTCPILRKDFLSRRYEIAQAAAHGADAVLLIVAGLRDEQLAELQQEARRFALDVLVEVHDEADLERAHAAGAEIIGINNRDLRTFTVDLAVTERLAAKVAASVLLVSESGLTSAADVRRVQAAGAQAVLIGEAAMRSGTERCSWIAGLRDGEPARNS